MDTDTHNPGIQAAGLNRKGLRGILAQSVLVIFGLAVLFISAGTVMWLNGWIYTGTVCLYFIVSTIVLAKLNPQLLNERGRVTGAGTKAFDRIWLALYPVFAFGSLVVMGFDAVRFQWSVMPFWLAIAGIVLFMLVTPLSLSSMVVNRFFEWTVRIQDDRGQYVCTDGPYRLIRHPGYAGLIGSTISYPFILGSWWGLLPNLILAAIVVVRTALEDRTLQAELPGYREYAQRVKYRLVPFVW